MRLKYVGGAPCSALDPLTIAVDAISLTVFFTLAFFASKAKRAFHRSEQALAESASIISVIVDALTSRIEQSESVVNHLQTEMDNMKTAGASVEWEQATLNSSHLQLLRSLQEILTKDKRLEGELSQLKTKLAPYLGSEVAAGTPPRRDLGDLDGRDILISLTPTERATLEIIYREGPKAAPELGKRLNKSREHTSRLMKKLYLEGYVARESNHAPFRYKLSETVRSAMEPGDVKVTAEASEKA